jgi:hypothetical protein
MTIESPSSFSRFTPDLLASLSSLTFRFPNDFGRWGMNLDLWKLYGPSLKTLWADPKNKAWGLATALGSGRSHRASTDPNSFPTYQNH